MTPEIITLAFTAASIAFFHTLFGPDHYVPFIVMSKAKKWSYCKTVLITLLCGIGHVLSSVVLGLLGVAFGIAVGKLAIFESTRGEWAAWLLIAFGLVYTVYGIRQAIKNKPHTHLHFHQDGKLHKHVHGHSTDHAHIHEDSSFSYVPWVLFVIFIFGPCEPLIPLIMYPAAKHSYFGMVVVALIFSLITISTMLFIVISAAFSINILPFKRFEKYTHAFSGFAILLCGLAIRFLGL